MLNESKFWVLKYLPLLRVPMESMGLLERPSTSLANNSIVIMCNDHTKEEMHILLEQTLKERGIKAER